MIYLALMEALMAQRKLFAYRLVGFGATFLLDRFAFNFTLRHAIAVAALVGICGAAGENAKHRRK